MDFDDAARLDTSQVQDARGRGGGGAGTWGRDRRRRRAGRPGRPGDHLARAGRRRRPPATCCRARAGAPARSPAAAPTSRSAAGPAPTPTATRTAASSGSSTACRPSGRRRSRAAGTLHRRRHPAVHRLHDHRLRQRDLRGRPVLLPGRRHRLRRPRLLRGAAHTYGASGGDFAQAYVLAHEYGHHVQDLLGTSTGPGGPPTGGAAGSVGPARAAGRLLRRGLDRGRQRNGSSHRRRRHPGGPVGGRRRRRRPDPAEARRVDPESWTHGSAAQRQTWFRRGLSSGDPGDCDTSRAASDGRKGPDLRLSATEAAVRAPFTLQRTFLSALQSAPRAAPDPPAHADSR